MHHQKWIHRAGVLLHDFVPDHVLQTDLFGQVDVSGHSKSLSRMKAIDSLNDRYGKRTVRLASENLANAWKPRYNLRSPRYASRWDELPIVKA